MQKIFGNIGDTTLVKAIEKLGLKNTEISTKTKSTSAEIVNSDISIRIAEPM